jgi:hypothetical protein
MAVLFDSFGAKDLQQSQSHIQRAYQVVSHLLVLNEIILDAEKNT